MIVDPMAENHFGSRWKVCNLITNDIRVICSDYIGQVNLNDRMTHRLNG